MLISVFSFAQAKVDFDLLHLEQAIFSASSAEIANEFRLAKFDLLLQNHLYDQAKLQLEEIEIDQLKSDSVRANLLWNASVLSYMQQLPNRAEHFYRQYAKQTADSSIYSLELKAILLVQQDSAEFENCLTKLVEMDSSFHSLRCYQSLLNIPTDNSTPFLICSMLVPGSGMILCGYPVKGLTSMALVGSTALFAAKLIQQSLWVNAISVLTIATLRFYLGNITLTDTLYHRHFQKKIARRMSPCKAEFEALMKKYPIDFK
jgi:hypothetical protein